MAILGRFCKDECSLLSRRGIVMRRISRIAIVALSSMFVTSGIVAAGCGDNGQTTSTGTKGTTSSSGGEAGSGGAAGTGGIGGGGTAGMGGGTAGNGGFGGAGGA